jgi:hypothetical protein
MYQKAPESLAETGAFSLRGISVFPDLLERHVLRLSRVYTACAIASRTDRRVANGAHGGGALRYFLAAHGFSVFPDLLFCHVLPLREYSNNVPVPVIQRLGCGIVGWRYFDWQGNILKRAQEGLQLFS